MHFRYMSLKRDYFTYIFEIADKYESLRLLLWFIRACNLDEKTFEFFGYFGNVLHQNQSESLAVLLVVLVGLEVAGKHAAGVAGKWSCRQKKISLNREST